MSTDNAMNAMNILTQFIPMITGSGTTSKQGGLTGGAITGLTNQLNNGTYSKAAATSDTQMAVQNAIKTMMQQYAPSILNNSRNAGSFNSSGTQNSMSQLEGNAAAAAGGITANQIAQYQQNQAQMAGVISNNSGTQKTSPLNFTNLLMPLAGGMALNAIPSGTFTAANAGKLLTNATDLINGGDTTGSGVAVANSLDEGTLGGSASDIANFMNTSLAPTANATQALMGTTDITGANLFGSTGSQLAGMGAELAPVSADLGAGVGTAAGADLGAGVAADATGAVVGADAAGGASMLADLLPVLAWIVCTELKDQGKLNKRWWANGLIYFNLNYDEDAIRAYHLWATPVVAHMKKKPNGKLNKLMEIIFVNRAEWIAADSGLKDANKTWKGFLGFWAAEIFTILVGIVTLNKGVLRVFKLDKLFNSLKGVLSWQV